MAREPYRDTSSTIPASRAEAVVPSDTQGIEICRALYVGVGGNLSVQMADGGAAVFQNVPAGSFLPVQCSRVNAASTTASSILALY